MNALPHATQLPPANHWQARIAALKNRPGVMKLIWQAAPKIVASSLSLRFLVALTPLGILWVARRIIDAVNARNVNHASAVPHLWSLLWMEFGLAAGGLRSEER